MTKEEKYWIMMTCFTSGITLGIAGAHRLDFGNWGSAGSWGYAYLLAAGLAFGVVALGIGVVSSGT